MVMINSNRFKTLASFAVIYLVWGSTYLAIRWGVETIPPFLLAGLRFAIAGLVLTVWALWRGAPMPRLRHWGAAALVGALLMCGGNAVVTWSEQFVPSGIAALIITTVPLWMVVLSSVLFRAGRPGPWVVAGLLTGFVGVAILVLPASGGVPAAPTLGVLALVLASLSWALGSLLSRVAPLPGSLALATGMEMLLGGVVSIAVGTILGEWPRLDLSKVSAISAWSFAYLILFGSIVALSAYQWLLRTTTPAAASTYAFVNPVVAIALGAAVGHEAITDRTFYAALLIVGAVVAIHLSRVRPRWAARKRRELPAFRPRIEAPMGGGAAGAGPTVSFCANAAGAAES